MKSDEQKKKKDLGRKFKVERILKDMTQRQLANNIGVSQMFISSVERGDKLSPRVIRLLNDFFGVDYE